jgi:ABC-type transporter Mla subunit MlaD
MSMADVRAAFILAGGGDLSLTDAAMRHVGEGAHVLQFVGAHRDGARFDHISPPFRGDPDQRAREIAAELVAAATMINQQEDRSMPAPAPIAGLASTLRDHLREATARADQVARRAKESVSNLHQVLDAVEGTVQQLDTAAADIQAALGLSTNGGPPLDPANHDD